MPSRLLIASRLAPTRIVFLRWWVWVLVTVAPALAHDPGLSTADVRLADDAAHVTVTLSPVDAALLAKAAGGPSLEDKPGNGWETMARSWCEWVDSTGQLRPSAARVNTEAQAIRFTIDFPRRSGGSVGLKFPRLSSLPPGHREFVCVSDALGAVVTKKFLSAGDAEIDFPMAATATATVHGGFGSWLGFLRLGVEHIWTGYDHLLFLLGLLIVCQSYRSVLAIISCFTVAHSITLALATLDVVHVSSRFVEPAIAASIVFVGIENLVREGEPSGRWVLTFLFGLVHGFGFASALRDLGIGSGSSVVVPLIAFNAGVEVGQVAIAAVTLPLIWRLRRVSGFVRGGVPVASAIVGAAGAYWFIERTILA